MEPVENQDEYETNIIPTTPQNIEVTEFDNLDQNIFYKI